MFIEVLALYMINEQYNGYLHFILAVLRIKKLGIVTPNHHLSVFYWDFVILSLFQMGVTNLYAYFKNAQKFIV